MPRIDGKDHEWNRSGYDTSLPERLFQRQLPRRTRAPRGAVAVTKNGPCNLREVESSSG